MATPTAAELKTQLINISDLYKELRNFAENNGANDLLSIIDTATQATEGDNAAGILAGFASIRSSIASAYNDSSPWDAHLEDWRRLIGAPDEEDIWDAMYRYFVDNSDSVETRVMSFGSISAGGGNTGSGTLVRVTVDDRAEDIESATTEAKTARCIGDANTGSSRNAELFLITGATGSPDGLESLGSGTSAEISAIRPEDGEALNAGFDEGTTVSTTITIPSWTPSTSLTTTEYSYDTTNIYLPAPNEQITPQALNIKVTATLTQRIDLRGTALSQDTPYYCQIAWNRTVGSGGGTLALHMGAKSNSVVASAQSGWQILSAIATPNTDSWYRNFVEEALDIKVIWTRTSGDLLIDDLIFAPMTEIDGIWHIILPGATPFRAGTAASSSGDVFTWTDSATESIIQRHIARLYGRYLPHSASPTIADP